MLTEEKTQRIRRTAAGCEKIFCFKKAGFSSPQAFLADSDPVIHFSQTFENALDRILVHQTKFHVVNGKVLVDRTVHYPQGRSFCVCGRHNQRNVSGLDIEFCQLLIHEFKKSGSGHIRRGRSGEC